MSRFEPILKALKEILQNKKHFSYAILETANLYSLNDIEINQLKISVNSILRNYQKLTYEASNLFPLLINNSDELLLTMIALKFIRDKNDIKEVQSSFISTCLAYRLSPEIQNSFGKIQIKGSTRFHIEERVKSDPILYNSIQLELPYFLLKRLQSEYTTDQIIFIAKKLQRNNLFYYLPNIYKKSNKVNLKQTNINGINAYCTTSNKEAEIDLEKNLIYSISNVEIRAYSSIPTLGYMSNILLAGIRKTFSGYFFDMSLDKLNPKIISVIDNYNIYSSSNEIIKDYNLKHTSFLPSSFKLLKTYLASNSYDLVVYKGNCSHIGLSSIHPAILPALSEEEFSKCIEKQAVELNTISDFVNKNGYLLFLNYSITKDENLNIIRSFLDKNRDFELVTDEKVVLNNDDSFMGYFALLKRDK